jgi:hypothetical protein
LMDWRCKYQASARFSACQYQQPKAPDISKLFNLG